MGQFYVPKWVGEKVWEGLPSFYIRSPLFGSFKFSCCLQCRPLWRGDIFLFSGSGVWQTVLWRHSLRYTSRQWLKPRCHTAGPFALHFCFNFTLVKSWSLGWGEHSFLIWEVIFGLSTTSGVLCILYSVSVSGLRPGPLSCLLKFLIMSNRLSDSSF